MGELDFLAGCMQKFGCQHNGSSDVNTLPPGYIYSPFVTLKCGENMETLTVGNKSLPARGNTAVIKSLEYGVSEGQGCKIEILDEEGGSFYNFFTNLNKSIEDIPKNTSHFELDFGWIIEEECSNSSVGKIAVSTHAGLPEKYIYLNPLRMQVSYEGAKIKYTIEAQDPMSRVTETRAECNLGTEDKKMPLKQAIRQLCEKRDPGPKCNVQFLSADGKSELKFKKSDGQFDGPKNVWTANQQNKLAVIRRWLSGMVTENNKGIIINWKGDKPASDESAGTLVIMESPANTMCQTLDPCVTNISTVTNNPGTYIVNGGNRTSVINFSPSVTWPLVNIGKAGGAQSSMDGGGAKQKGQPQCSDDRSSAGAATFTAAGSNDINHTPPEKSVEKRSQADTANQQANAFRDMILNPIEAELKIFGDPSLVYPLLLVAKTLSLIVINPFHIRNLGGDCPDWLAKPLCNPVFSNKRWMIIGVNHQIKEGSYVTILKLKLDVPNVDLRKSDPIGGPGSGGQSLDIKTQPDPSKCET